MVSRRRWLGVLSFSARLLTISLSAISLSALVACRTSNQEKPSGTVSAEAPLRVAVAANYLRVAREQVRIFEHQSGRPVELSAGSSGQLLAQIEQGAPFDIFLSADELRPRRLAHARRGAEGRLFSYAVGRLTLVCGLHLTKQCEQLQSVAWDRDSGIVRFMRSRSRIALADPRLAPYGLAAEQVMKRLDVLNAIRHKLVQGESVAQAYQFLATGNVDIAFVALSQAKQSNLTWLLVPDRLHQVLNHQGIILRDSPSARKFVEMLTADPAALSLTREGGYELPSGTTVSR
jgi:molybdate transport system substrate-binding protein